MARYKKLDCKSQTKLYHSLKKYGFDNHSCEIVESCTEPDMLIREAYWGHHFNVLSESGLNLQLPKPTDKKSAASKEVRDKISSALKGRTFSPEWRSKLSNQAKLRTGDRNGAYGKPRPDFAKMSRQRDRYGVNNPMFGRTQSIEARDKISSARKGKPFPPKQKIVVCLETGIFYDSAKEACKAYTYKYSYLVSMLNGRKHNKTCLIYG